MIDILPDLINKPVGDVVSALVILGLDPHVLTLGEYPTLTLYPWTVFIQAKDGLVVGIIQSPLKQLTNG